MIDWTNFTPASALIGGIIIGLAVTVLLLFNGRIAGISGIVGGLFSFKQGNQSWRVIFIVGLLVAPLLYSLFTTLPVSQVESSPTELIIAGLLVGVGTRYASGCTSGHGVCGLSRLSPRSIVATATFMLASFVTVFMIRHILNG